VDGEFTLARYGDAFEVQNRQIHCSGNSAPRCNKGMAVRAGSHVIVTDIAWGASSIMVDGNRVKCGSGRVDLGGGFSYSCKPKDVEVRFNEASVRCHFGPGLLDVYVTAPVPWSTGTVTGLCGNYNGVAADDKAMIDSGRQYYVAGTGRSLFANPRARSEADIETEDANFEAEQDAQQDVIDDAYENAGLLTGRPHHNVVVAFQNSAQREAAKMLCQRGIHGQDRRDCEYDLIAGIPIEDGRTFQMAQVMDHEVLLDICQTSEKEYRSSLFPPRDPRGEGFSVSFWFQQTDGGSDKDRLILNRGDDFSVRTRGSDLIVRNGNDEDSTDGLADSSTSCVASNVIQPNTWVQVVATISKRGSIIIYINGKEAARKDITNNPSAIPTAARFENQPMFVLTSSENNDAAQGNLAHIFFVPVTVLQTEVSRFSDRRAPETCPA